MKHLLLIAVLFVSACQFAGSGKNLPALPEVQTETAITKIGEIPLPEGYARIVSEENSFAYFLRQLPLRQDDNTVYLYNGEKKGNQDAQFAVVNLPIGKKDLQQCADVCMRLWAEYLYKSQEFDRIHFNFLSDGKPRYYKDKVGADRSREQFDQYLEWIFNYANTKSLFHELETVQAKDIQPGDVFIKTGNPIGHAMMVADVAQDAQGNKIFLLLQGYMPAQDIHVVKNYGSATLNPWYAANYGSELTTPEFRFHGDYAIKRFK